MRNWVMVLAVAAALGGCLTPAAQRQSSELIGLPLSEAVARYGAPDQAPAEGAGAYSWSGGRLGGACRLNVRTGPDGRITRANVVAIGFQTCDRVLEARRDG